MATMVLHSQYSLRDRFPVETLTSPPLKPRGNDGKSKPNSSTKPSSSTKPCSTRSARIKRTSVGSQDKESRRSRCQKSVARLPAKNLIIGQVRILKRGEVLEHAEEFQAPKVLAEDEEAKKMNEVLDLCSMDRLGQEPEMVPKQFDVKSVNCNFSGLAFLTSPPPSSLPLPGFLTRRKNDDAITDLQRIMLLDLS